MSDQETFNPEGPGIYVTRMMIEFPDGRKNLYSDDLLVVSAASAGAAQRLFNEFCQEEMQEEERHGYGLDGGRIHPGIKIHPGTQESYRAAMMGEVGRIPAHD